MKSERWSIHVVGLLLSLILSSCWSEKEENLPIEEDEVTTANELEMEMEEYAESRRDNVQTRVNRMMDDLRKRLQKIEDWMERKNIPEDARLRSEKLRNDLERIKRDLEASLDSLQRINSEEFSEMETRIKSRIQQIEDELDQINEEMNEWKEENIN